jgi:hypothetical protein
MRPLLAAILSLLIFIALSGSPRRRAVLVDASATESHLDPLTAAPAKNPYLRTVVPFLRRIAR